MATEKNKRLALQRRVVAQCQKVIMQSGPAAMVHDLASALENEASRANVNGDTSMRNCLARIADLTYEFAKRVRDLQSYYSADDEEIAKEAARRG